MYLLKYEIKCRLTGTMLRLLTLAKSYVSSAQKKLNISSYSLFAKINTAVRRTALHVKNYNVVNTRRLY